MCVIFALLTVKKFSAYSQYMTQIMTDSDTK